MNRHPTRQNLEKHSTSFCSMNDTGRAKIFLVDDHALILESYANLLDPHHDIVGDAQDAKNLVSRIQRTNPDILILDIALPEQNGFETARILRDFYPFLKIIFVSMYLEPAYIVEAFRSGGHGYVPKQTAGRELLFAIQQVLENHIYISPLIPDDIRRSILS